MLEIIYVSRRLYHFFLLLNLMVKYLAYLFNDDYIEVSEGDQSPPLNTFAFLTEEYDIVDFKGNNIRLFDKEKLPLFERVMKEMHEKRTIELRAKINEYNDFISSLETKSQNVSEKESFIFSYKISEKVKKYIELIDDINLQIYKLNLIYSEKYNNLSSTIVNNIPKNVKFAQDSRNFYPEPRMIQNIPAVSSGMIQQMYSRVSNVQGWDEYAVITVQNWRLLFKEYKYIYEWILERNHKISTHLNLISVVSSSMMGCFSAFKLWVQDDRTFQASSDIIMLFSNFLIAAITTSSKRYIDDNRNEKIRNYLEDVNKFLGTISAELIKSPEYRMHADEFIKSQQEIYAKLSTNKPNITISELTAARNAYKNFENSFISFSSHQTQTDDETNLYMV